MKMHEYLTSLHSVYEEQCSISATYVIYPSSTVLTLLYQFVHQKLDFSNIRICTAKKTFACKIVVIVGIQKENVIKYMYACVCNVTVVVISLQD